MRLIDADALKEKAHMIEIFDKQWVVDEIEIDMAPTADVVPVVRGEWIEDGDMQICSNCGEEHSWEEYRASYCEDCGAKMEDKP